jgi:hypothetical protein
MMNGAMENDHAFSIELDVVKLNEIGDRVLIEGYIGELIEVNFVEDLLEIKGVEGKMRVNLTEEELKNFLYTRRKSNRRLQR